MSTEYKEITKGVKAKLSTIFSMYSKLKEENKRLLEREKELEQKIEEKEKEIEFIKNKYNKVKLAKGILASSGDKHDAKIKINRIVREIDKCIALLNK